MKPNIDALLYSKRTLQLSLTVNYDKHSVLFQCHWAYCLVVNLLHTGELMKIDNITLIINDDIQALNNEFVARAGAWADMNTRLRFEYVPSAQAHYMDNGNVGCLNNILQAIENGRGCAKFRPLIIKLSAHKYCKEKKKFIGKKDPKKFTALAKMNKERGAPVWACHIVDFLAKEEAQNKAARERTFDQRWDSLMTSVRNMAEKAETDEQKTYVRLSLDALTA